MEQDSESAVRVIWPGYMLITLWLFNIAMENPLKTEVLTGKSSIKPMFHGYVK
jgi:hypothetical protein